MIRILIIAFGNPLRSDDGVAWCVAEKFSEQITRQDVQVLTAHQLTPEIAEIASHAGHILFVDASRQGEPGRISCKPVERASERGAFSHQLTPATLLKLTAELYGRCPTAHLLTITGESFEVGETLSPAVIAAIPELLARIKEFVEADLKCS